MVSRAAAAAGQETPRMRTATRSSHAGTWPQARADERGGTTTFSPLSSASVHRDRPSLAQRPNRVGIPVRAEQLDDERWEAAEAPAALTRGTASRLRLLRDRGAR